MALLSLRNVRKSFDGVEALSCINLDVHRGETIAIVGPSGCGKTTLLRCISLLSYIDRGTILLADNPVVSVDSTGARKVHVDLNSHRARVGMVFQHLNVWPHLTVVDNMILAPRVVRQMARPQAVRRAKDLLQKMGMVDKFDQYPMALSGGQLQRVALARALMMTPEILLLDEITSALDPELVGEILEIIADLATGGMTLLIVTHEMLFASEVADRVVFLADGCVVEEGDPKEVFDSPKSPRLQTFLKRVTRHRTTTGVD